MMYLLQSILVQSLLSCYLPEDAFNMQKDLHSPVEMFLSSRQVGCSNCRQ